MNEKKKIGIVDTMFSRVNMGELAIDELNKHSKDLEIVRTTVPGIKDLAPECLKLLNSGCEICMALGMVGGASVDLQCAHEASLGIMQAKILTGRHIIEVFVHEKEGWSEKEFYSICDNRTRKHAVNALLLISNPNELTKLAGKGIRQGKEDEGSVIPGTERKIGVGIVVSTFNKEISDAMLNCAIEEIKSQNAESVSIMKCMGAYDMPILVMKSLEDKKVDAIVCLGFVKKGETKHDKIVAETASEAFTKLSIEYRKPVTLGLIGHGATNEQAEKRKEDYAKRAVQSAISLVKELRK
ncbi:riboflavin synthase [Candidatus Micrarchaeota archaeon]|nr:riboflavin synthase [Candidatus Micrarchaeota archaeon]